MKQNVETNGTKSKRERIEYTISLNIEEFEVVNKKRKTQLKKNQNTDGNFD